MHVSTAPALFSGLGARILMDVFTRTDEPSIQDYILFGVWQGVGLHYAFTNSELGLLVALGIVVKLSFDFTYVPDTTKSALTLLGVVLGVMCTEVLSGYFDKPQKGHKKSTNKTGGDLHPHRERVVQFHRSTEKEPITSSHHRAFRQSYSDITSVDSSSELIGIRPSMTPRDREIAALRTRASLADSERRRFKEERTWAVAQGNMARASQMKWQVKRYTALMQSFHRQADALVIDATNERARQSAINVKARAAAGERHSRTHGIPNGSSQPLINDGAATESRHHHRHRSSATKSSHRPHPG